jgi:hypothetical protein
MPAWAMLPRISSAYRRWSKLMEEWKLSAAASVPEAKRPPHSPGNVPDRSAGFAGSAAIIAYIQPRGFIE